MKIMKIQITENDIRLMARAAVRMINEVKLADRMADPNNPAYEEGWPEYRAKYAASYGDPTLIKHWREKGKYNYYNGKVAKEFNAKQKENYDKIIEIAQSFSVVPFESLDLDKYNGVYFWDSSKTNHQYIVLDKHDCKGPATEDELQESIDRAKEVFGKMAEAIQEALPWKGTSEYSFYTKKGYYGSGQYELGAPVDYEDTYAYKFDGIDFPTRSVLSSHSKAHNAADIRGGLDWSEWKHQNGYSYKGKDSKQDFFQDYSENSFDNHVKGWVIVADVLSYMPLRRAKDAETLGEKMIQGADIQIAFEFDDQYNTDYRAMRNAENAQVELYSSSRD